jgi:hypothetical protein
MVVLPCDCGRLLVRDIRHHQGSLTMRRLHRIFPLFFAALFSGPARTSGQEQVIRGGCHGKHEDHHEGFKRRLLQVIENFVGSQEHPVPVLE